MLCIVSRGSRVDISHHIGSNHSHFNTGIEYSGGKIAIFPLLNDDLSEDPELSTSNPVS